MQKISLCLTVLFESPFWIGICELTADEASQICKITFGAEPKDSEVADFLKQNWQLLHFTPPLVTEKTKRKKVNPKRLQRIVRKESQKKHLGTKSQQALKLLHETEKTAKRVKKQKQKALANQLQFAKQQQKKREKHKGH